MQLERKLALKETAPAWYKDPLRAFKQSQTAQQKKQGGSGRLCDAFTALLLQQLGRLRKALQSRMEDENPGKLEI